jgi:hypothetical protein
MPPIAYPACRRSNAFASLPIAARRAGGAVTFADDYHL